MCKSREDVVLKLTDKENSEFGEGEEMEMLEQKAEIPNGNGDLDLKGDTRHSEGLVVNVNKHGGAQPKTKRIKESRVL